MNIQPFSQTGLIISNDWAVLWVLLCYVHLTVCSYHVTYAFYSESTLCSYLNVKELLAQNQRSDWPVWLNGWVFVYELSGCGFESRCGHYWITVSGIFLSVLTRNSTLSRCTLTLQKKVDCTKETWRNFSNTTGSLTLFIWNLSLI